LPRDHARSDHRDISRQRESFAVRAYAAIKQNVKTLAARPANIH
jgi:hypothetical protein